MVNEFNTVVLVNVCDSVAGMTTVDVVDEVDVEVVLTMLVETVLDTLVNVAVPMVTSVVIVWVAKLVTWVESNEVVVTVTDWTCETDVVVT